MTTNSGPGEHRRLGWGIASNLDHRGESISTAPALASSYATSYVSSLLGERLAAGEPLVEAESARVHGALLLTDIEGWTSQVERLRDLGPEGLDELARSLNAYFVRLTEIVYRHGGDVLTVWGDSFLCCWSADAPDGIDGATTQAAQAALAFQQAAEHRAPSGERLRTRMGIAAGELDVALVGGLNGRWELLPSGAPLDDVLVAERLAPADGVVLSGSAWEKVADIAEGDELDGGLFALTALHGARRLGSTDRGLEIGAHVIEPFVPAPLRGWRASSSTEWLAELRHVTVMMVRLLGTGHDEPLLLERRQLAVRTFQETIARFGGASKPGVDNKGLIMSGVFGLPSRAHEDDPERALRAAAALRLGLEELGLPCSVGVASGRAFCGLFGNDVRREYTLHGDVTNLAARLAFAGAGEVLCDEVTARTVRESFRFESLAPIAVKGRAQPVAIRRFLEMGARTVPRHSPLVNRTDERAIVAERLQMLTEAGERGAVVLEGDAGIGKSALVAEAAHLARRMGNRVLTAAADAVESATGYYAWRPVFADVLGIESDVPEPATVQRLALERLGGAPELERLTPLLSGVLPVTIADNETTAAMSGDLRANNTTILLAGLLSRLTASAPVLLVVEDAHWLDSNSWSVLHEVVRSVPRLLALVTARPAAAESDAYRGLFALPETVPVRLDALTAEHTRALVCQRLGVAAIPHHLSRFVEDRVAGHPFFCEALVKTMQEGGIVRVREGTTVVGELEGIEMPSTVEGAVLSLVDRLTSQQQLSLKVAAVVGQTFSARAVAEAHPVSSERRSVPDDLRALTALELIVREQGEAELAYTFRHDITRQVAYGLLTESQRRPLHRAVAEFYERSFSPEDLEPHHALLAHHWAQAEDTAKATDYLEKAGRQALHGGAFREAAHFYAQLLERGAAAADERRALWAKGEATAHYFLGDFERSRVLLERAVGRLDREIPKSAMPMARALLTSSARQVVHLGLPSRFRGRRGAEKAVLDEAVDCYRRLVQIHYLNGEAPTELVYLQLAGLNLGEEAGSSPDLARALANAAALAGLAGLKGLADRYAARAVRMADLEGQSEALAYVWNLHALIEAQRGRWRKGIQASDRALELFGEIGDYNLEAELWQTRSALHICAGDFAGAEACWTRTRELAARNANPQLECWSLLDEVQTQVGRGEVEPATRALEAALAIDTAESDGGTLIEKHYATAATRLLEGRRDEAMRAADAVIDMITAHPPTGFHWADFAAGAVAVHLDLLEDAAAADRPELERRARRGCRVLGRTALTFRGIRPRRWLLRGRLEWARGRRERAVRAWRKAESVALAMEMDYDVAWSRLELVRHGVAGAGESALRADAVSTFERLGAAHHLRSARRA